MPSTPGSLVPPLGCSMPSSTNPACTVQMTTGQAALIRRACVVLLDIGDAENPLTETEREELEAIADMAAEVDPEAINGWCL